MATLNQSLSLVRPRLVSLLAMSGAIPLLAELTVVDEALLSSRLAQQALGDGRKRVARVGQASIGVQAIRWQDRFVCPRCIERGVYSSILWELEACTCCAVHKICLTNVCNRCGRHLSWETAPFDQCSCGHSLALLPSKPAKAFETAICLHLEASTLHSLGDSSVGRTNAPSFDPCVFLDSLLLFVEFTRFMFVPSTSLSPNPSTHQSLAKDVGKQVSQALCDRNLRLLMCGRVTELTNPTVLGGRSLTERSLAELKWMFGGVEPPEALPLRDQMVSRRRRWQGIAPALVIAESTNWSQR